MTCCKVSSALQSFCVCFRQVVANDWAFAARRDDGEVVCWGDRASGGDVTPVAQRIADGGCASGIGSELLMSLQQLIIVTACDG